MADLIQLTINGLALGSIYALVALGFVLVYVSTGVVNFAVGEFVMIGAFLGVTMVLQANLSLGPAYALALLAMGLFGVLFYGVVYLPLRKRPVITIIIGTVAAGIILQNAALLTWGSFPFRLPSPFSGKVVRVGGAVISVHNIAVIAATGLLIAALRVLLYRTRLGSAMRAVAQDVETARLMGLKVDLFLIFTWILAALLAAIAGLLLGPIWFADVNMGGPVALKAFAATIIGGFGSVEGAIAGGIFVGLTEILGASYISSTYKDAFSFLFMVLFLLLRPQGIFGERIADRG
jgi:branched-chain amino acid transport system permease protein